MYIQSRFLDMDILSKTSKTVKTNRERKTKKGHQGLFAALVDIRIALSVVCLSMSFFHSFFLNTGKSSYVP